MPATAQLRTRTRKRAFDHSPPPRRRDRGQARVFSRKAESETDKRILALKNYQERQIPDPFANQYTSGTGSNEDFQVLQPHFDFGVLLSLPNENHTLKQCIDAMATNIEGFGHRFEYIGPEDQRDGDAAVKELERLEQLMDRPNADYGLLELRKRLRMDKEILGACYIEVMRDLKGRIAAFSHVPAHLIRKTTKDSDTQVVHHALVRDGKTTHVPVRKNFRRYVQLVGSRRVYFKEFGDPRVIHFRTGLETNEQENAATEIIEMSMYSPNHNYGLPRWINQLPAIIGSRECEVTNLSFFKDNAIPAMAVLVSGGALTEASVQAVEEAFTRGRGLEAMNRVLVIEALGDEDAADDEGRIPPPRVDMKPLSGERQADGLFHEYDEANHTKIRSSFRLPPLFLGRADDYTRATAEASLVVAETQVFAPERDSVDDVFGNQLLLDEKGEPPRYWKFRSNPARMTAPGEILEALTTLDTIGALTPNIAIGMTNELFNLDIEEIEDLWGDYPFALVTSGKVPVTGELLDDLVATLTVEPEEDKEVDEEEEEAKKAVVDTVRKYQKVMKDAGKTVSRKRTRRRVARAVSKLA